MSKKTSKSHNTASDRKPRGSLLKIQGKKGKSGGSDLRQLDDEMQTWMYEQINLLYSSSRPDDRLYTELTPYGRNPKPNVQQENDTDVYIEIDGNSQVNGGNASTSTPAPSVQNLKKAPPKLQKPSATSQKPKPKSPEVAPTPRADSNASNSIASWTPAPVGDYNPDECPYAVLDVESLNQPRNKNAQSTPQPLPATSEQTATAPQQHLLSGNAPAATPASAAVGDGAEPVPDGDEPKEPIYADIIGVLKE